MSQSRFSPRKARLDGEPPERCFYAMTQRRPERKAAQKRAAAIRSVFSSGILRCAAQKNQKNVWKERSPCRKSAKRIEHKKMGYMEV